MVQVPLPAWPGGSGRPGPEGALAAFSLPCGCRAALFLLAVCRNCDKRRWIGFILEIDEIPRNIVFNLTDLGNFKKFLWVQI